MTTASRSWQLDWPASGAGRVAKATLKASPETFFVDEDLGLAGFPQADGGASCEPGGSGEHLCLRLEKAGDNTDYVARQLAELAGCRHQDVGYCGLKDRHAVTRQWYSIYRPGQEADDAAFLERVRGRWTLLAAHRYVKKLRRGDHQGNVFAITLTDVDGDVQAIEAALTELADQGCPNYFGPQRFGRGGGNLDRAIAMASQPPRRGRGRRGQAGRQRDGLYFSAARSWLFNQVLARRVEQGNWNRRLDGEPAVDTVTGPLWGDGGTVATGSQEALERRVTAAHPELLAVFADSRMKPERRALVLTPQAFSWQWVGEGRLLLRFWLAPGQYATSLLGNVFWLDDVAGAEGLAEEP